jgi:hypothetical protein
MNHDIGGWTSGASITTQPVQARDVQVGDRLLYDGIVVSVTGTRSSSYWLNLVLVDGVAIDWKSGNRLGRMFRADDDTLDRVERAS